MVFECDECSAQYVNVLTPKEVSVLQSELADLRWFRDQVNKNVLPGVSDTHDSAREFINASMRIYRKMEKVVEAAREIEGCMNPFVKEEIDSFTVQPLTTALRELDAYAQQAAVSEDKK
jgi:hypothetical protein